MKDGTYNTKDEPINYENGYQVGLWDKPIKGDNIEDLIASIKRNWRGDYGIWRDTNTGDLFIEPCVWVKDEAEAASLAVSYNQRAIWSWTFMKEITIN